LFPAMKEEHTPICPQTVLGDSLFSRYWIKI